MLDLAIQIVNYKTKRYLADCLDSVIKDLAGSGISCEILVLDNHSGDNLDDLEKRYKGNKVRFFYSDKNLGFGAGHNFLSRKSTSKYLLVLNPDLIIQTGTIKILFDFMESNPQAGMCGPRVSLPERNFFFTKRVFWPKKFALKEFFRVFLKIKIFDSVKELEHHTTVGSAIFIRRQIFEQAGGFDERLFLYFEESDLSNAVRRLGYKIFFIWDAMAVHFYGKSEMSKAEKVKHFKNSRRYFYRKWYDKDRAERRIAVEEFLVGDKVLEKIL